MRPTDLNEQSLIIPPMHWVDQTWQTTDRVLQGLQACCHDNSTAFLPPRLSLRLSLMHTHTLSLLSVCLLLSLLHTHIHTHRVQYYSGICLCFRISSTDSKTKTKKKTRRERRGHSTSVLDGESLLTGYVCLHAASFGKSAFHYTI